jgi:hypothetical protein
MVKIILELTEDIRRAASGEPTTVEAGEAVIQLGWLRSCRGPPSQTETRLWTLECSDFDLF